MVLGCGLALVNMVLNLFIPKKRRISWLAERLSASREESFFMQIVGLCMYTGTHVCTHTCIILTVKINRILCSCFTWRPSIDLMFQFGEGNYTFFVNIYICSCFLRPVGMISRSRSNTQFLLGNLPASIFILNKLFLHPAAKLGPPSDSAVYKLLKLASLFLLTSSITAWILLSHTKYTQWLCKKSQISLRFQLPLIYKVWHVKKPSN